MAKEEYEYKTGKHLGHETTYLSGKHRKAKGEALKKKKEYAKSEKKRMGKNYRSGDYHSVCGRPWGEHMAGDGHCPS